MKRIFKISILYVLKIFGIFFIARKLTQNGLRILCYHNFGEGDDIRFRPQTFIRPKTFKRRLDYLSKKKYPIISIEDGVTALSGNTVPPCATVITIDDGWFGIKSFAHNLLSERKFPYTVYVTSYYAENETPIFELVIRYLFWKTKIKNWGRKIVDLASEMAISEIVIKEKSDIIEELITFGDKNLDNEGRTILMMRLSDILGVDYSKLLKNRILNLMNRSEISELANAGVDIQLHTHRHIWPLDFEIAKQEISQNKSFLEPLVENRLEHFCYPNGNWKTEQIKFFNALNIKSATTCDPGLNYSNTNIFALKRYVDSENKRQIEFEAELSGCLDLFYRVKNTLNIFKTVS